MLLFNSVRYCIVSTIVVAFETSVSETIRKPPLVKAQTALKTKKIYNMARNDFQYSGWNYYTLQCGMWLWDDMPRNSPKRPPYWNSTSGFDFDHITAVDIHSAPVCEILSKSDHPQQKKMTSRRFSRCGSQPFWILGVK